MKAAPPAPSTPRAHALNLDLSHALAVPPLLDSGADDSPSSPRWHHQSLSKGAAGVAILHAVRAQTGHGGEERVHAWLSRAVSEDLSVGPGAGLWFGAPAVAFAVMACDPHRYGSALTRLDAAVTSLVDARLNAATIRLAAAARPTLSEFDLVRGLTGLGAYLLTRDPHGHHIRRVLAYLVNLTQPVRADDEAGTHVPGWWTRDAPSRHPNIGSGHANLGMAHGISGPLALLALAMRKGVTVAGAAEAIDRITTWLDIWRQDTPQGPWWPEHLTLADIHTGQPSQTTAARPSWCYGTPGLARAQQLAALARHDPARQAAAEDALTRCVNDPMQLARITDPNLCHGWAGLAATVWYAAQDSDNDSLKSCVPRLLHTVIEHADDTAHHPLPGLIEGRAGVGLTVHTIATATSHAWPTCLLIN
jgi:hypothetical protein